MTFVLVIHGGAGSHVYKDRDKEIYAGVIKDLLFCGYNLLRNGEKSINVAQKIIKIMEDSALFNAGRGSVKSIDGTMQLYASIMDGSTLKFGAVSNVSKIKNPILMARFIMDYTNHTKINCAAAEKLAKLNGIKLIDPNIYYSSNYNMDQYSSALSEESQRTMDTIQMILSEDAEKSPMDTIQRMLSEDSYRSPMDTTRRMLSKDSEKSPMDTTQGMLSEDSHRSPMDTIGVIALDIYGNFAVASSTGGIETKLPGRSSDITDLGAGVYANNKTCCIACSGEGEFIARTVVAYDISAQIEYQNKNIFEAAYFSLQKAHHLNNNKPVGGIIGIDTFGNICIIHDTVSMLCGYVKSSADFSIFI